MNPYLEPHGFLGTGASLLADVTLLAYVFLIIPAMIAGFIFARRKMHRPHHKWTMTTITLINWILIAFLMLVAYRFDVAPSIGAQPDNTRYLLPTIHAVFGLTAQLLATFLVIRMFTEDSQVRRAKVRGETSMSKYWFKHAKPFMRLTLTLWLITAMLGVVSYLIRYDVLPTYTLSGKIAAPVFTPEVAAPVSTPEVGAPVETAEVTEPIATAELLAPVETSEVTEPISTPEVSVPVATEENQPTETSTRRASATRTPTRTSTATRTVRAPVETEEVTPVVTPELDG